MSKTQKVLQHLQEKGSITSWEAIQKYRATRLSGIIFNLKKKGYDIYTETETVYDSEGNYETHYARYYLVGEKQWKIN